MMQDTNFKLLRGFVTDGQTDRRTNERTFVIVESLSRLKIDKKLRSILQTSEYSELIHKVTNHPVHIQDEHTISPSSFIPFCQFGGRKLWV